MQRILFLLLPLAWASCGAPSENGAASSPQVQLEEELWEQVMAVHDEIMPRTSELERMAQKLKKHLDRDDLSPAQRQEIDETIKLIESAVAAMWDWMNDLQQLPQLRQTKTHEQIMSYLKTEHNNITTVKTLMENALAKGERLLRILEPPKQHAR